jgi:hypothetical protein
MPRMFHVANFQRDESAPIVPLMAILRSYESYVDEKAMDNTTRRINE